MTLKFELTSDMVNIISRALNLAPIARVETDVVIKAMQEQINAQQASTPATELPSNVVPIVEHEAKAS